MSQDQFEAKSKSIFSSLPAVEPSLYFAARVAARAQKPSRELTILRWVAALSLAAVVGLVVHIQTQPKDDLLYTYQPYVIQVDFNESEMKLVASAEIELPEGVSFVSKNEAVKSMRSLRMSLSSKNKLPFVLVSEKQGHIPLQVKMYNAQNELIHTKTLTLNFARKG